MKHLFSYLVLFVCFPLAGCFYIGQERFEDIVRNPPSTWSSRDCLTVILSAMVHNLHDVDKNVEVIATPFYPSVVLALNQIQRSQYHWSEDDAKYHLDELMRGSSGLYVDWKDGRFVNSRGNYFRDQTDIDSLLIVVTLKNKTYPCATPYATVVQPGKDGDVHYASVPLLATADWPCYMPNITDIGSRIWLISEKGDTLRPKYVWGRRHETLTTTETLFILFPLRGLSHHFLAESNKCWFEIAGFTTSMKFALITAKMR